MRCEFAKGKSSSDFSSEKSLYLNNAGSYKGVEYNIKVNRLYGRNDYHLLLVLNGEIKVSGQKIGDGKAYIFYPRTSQNYEYVAGENTLYYWLHFSGKDVEEILKSLNISQGVFDLKENSNKAENLFKMILSAYSTEMSYADEYASGLIISLLSLIASPVNIPSPFFRAIKILSDVNDTTSIKDIAASYSMSESHFIREFKKVTGTSPLSYKTNKRIEAAKEMLLSTNLSIHEISFMSGFSDPLYFSRIFKSRERLSPIEFRRKNITNYEYEN